MTAHLAAAMALLGLLVYVTVRAFYPAKIEGRGASQRFTLLAAFSAIATYALLLFGSHVTAQNAALVFTDWPLMNGVLIPIGPRHRRESSGRCTRPTRSTATWRSSWGSSRGRPRGRRGGRNATTRRSSGSRSSIAVLFPIQALIGGLQVLTQLAEWTQTLHLALGAVIWTLAAALAVAAYYEARTATVPATIVVGAGGTGQRR